MAKAYDLRQRTMAFALEVLRFCRRMPPSPEGWSCARSTSPSWNWRGLELSGRVPRKVEGRLIAKLGTVIEEADESDFWLELTERADWSMRI